VSLPEPLLDDALSPHLTLRATLDLHTPPVAVARALDALDALDPTADCGPEVHARFARVIDGPAHGDPARTARYLDALAFTQRLPRLDRDALTTVQTLVLGGPAPLRRTDAFARDGAHRYPWRDDLSTRVDEALHGATAVAVHPVVRACLVYLDVIFLHPFEDGNARAARLVMHHTLHRAGYGAPRFDDVLFVRKTPGDTEGFWRLVRITAGSIGAVARSRAHGSLPR